MTDFNRTDVDQTDLDLDLDLVDFDLTDLDRFADGFPDEVFTRLRRQAPVWWHPPTAHTPDGVGFWVLSAYSDIQAVAADAELFSSERAPGAEGGGTILQDLPYGFAPGVLLNMMDDPLHHRIRRLATPSLAPRALALMEVELRERAGRIVDAIAERGECDFLSEVAVELPLQAVAALMGVPDADRHDLMAWSNTTLDFEGRELGETNDQVAAAARRWRRTGRGSSTRSAPARVRTSSRPSPRDGWIRETAPTGRSPTSSC